MSDYSPICNVLILQDETSYISKYTGKPYILIFNQELWISESMDHSLVNTNQLQHYGTQVQDNTMSTKLMHIMTEDESFNMELNMSGKIIYNDTHTPSAQELNTCLHIILSSHIEWNPTEVKFKNSSQTFEDEMSTHH